MRITRCESPSPSLIKKGIKKESKQLVIGSIQILKHPPIAFPPNTPHQANCGVHLSRKLMLTKGLRRNSSNITSLQLGEESMIEVGTLVDQFLE